MSLWGRGGGSGGDRLLYCLGPNRLTRDEGDGEVLLVDEEEEDEDDGTVGANFLRRRVSFGSSNAHKT